MGHRLSKIYTRTGDDGTTGLGDGSRVAKEDLRIEALAAVDEANSAVGVVLAATVPDKIRQALNTIQHQLFDLGGELSTPGYVLVQQAHVQWLENTLDEFNAQLPPLKEFILPGGAPAAAYCHLARTIVRRAERRAWALARRDPIRHEVTCYLNRLSDLLFVMARLLARHEGGSEVLWQHNSTL